VERKVSVRQIWSDSPPLKNQHYPGRSAWSNDSCWSRCHTNSSSTGARGLWILTLLT